MILAFYSYKGGVGRTSLALDTAARLASGGEERTPLRVLVWDLDLDAPGVRHFPALEGASERATVGTHDLLGLLRVEQGSETGEPVKLETGRVLEVLRQAVVSTPEIADGRLSLLLPSGSDTPPAASDAAMLFAAGAPGPSLLVLIADLARRELGFDVVVVDARTGINDLSATATTVLADCAVLVFRLDGQDVAHLSDIATAIHDAWGRGGVSALDLPNRLYRVANLVPRGDEILEQAVQERRNELAGKRLEPHLELPLRPLALVRESIPRLDGPELDAEAADAVEGLADWAHQRWADHARREIDDAVPDASRHEEGAESPVGGFVAEVTKLLELAGWRPAAIDDEVVDGFDVVVEKTGDFGRRQVLLVECKASARGASVADVERVSARAKRVEGFGMARLDAMLVARRLSPLAMSAASSRDLLLTTPESLLDEQAPAEPLRQRARELWEGTALERQYVDPKGIRLDAKGHASGEAASLDELVETWLKRNKAGMLCVLGDFGAGKTTFCRRLAAGLTREEHGVDALPLYVDLRAAGSTAVTLDGLLRHALDEAQVDQARLAPWRSRLAGGSLILLVDGFDELLGYTDPARMESLLDELQGAAAQCRVILTSRSGYFRSDQDAARALRGRRAASSKAPGNTLWNRLRRRDNVWAVEVQPFDDQQIAQYLGLRFGGDRVGPILERLRTLHPVDDLIRRPYLLTLVSTSIDQWEERGWPDRLTLTSVYESYVADWLERDELKNRGLPGNAASLAQHLARVLWNRPGGQIGSRELRGEASAWGSAATGRHISPDEEETIEAKVRTALFLVRDERGAYRFAHRSFLEFFVAKGLADLLTDEPDLAAAQEALDLARLTPEVAAFIGGWPHAWERLPERCRLVLQSEAQPPRASANALLLLKWHGQSASDVDAPRLVQVENAILAGVNLSGADLAFAQLPGADFRAANLDGVDLSNADLSDADFRGTFAPNARLTGANLAGLRGVGAILTDADLSEANLSDAALVAADLKRATLMRADLRGADLTGVRLNQATLTGAQTQHANFAGAQLVDARLDHVDLTHTIMDGSDARFASLRGAVIPAASGANLFGGRTVPDASVIAGATIGHLHVRRPFVTCPITVHGRSCVALGCADGAVQLWAPAEGIVHTVRTGTGAPVTAMCSIVNDTGGSLLAIGDQSGMVALWDVSESAEMGRLEPQVGEIRAICAIALPDGTRGLATAAGESEIRIWGLDGRLRIEAFASSSGTVRALCPIIGRDGRWLLAGAADQIIELWDLEHGEMVNRIAQHGDWVRTLCTVPGPGGEMLLASAGDDGYVGLWSVPDGNEVGRFEGPGDWIRTVVAAERPDGSTILACGGDDSVIWVFDITNPERELVLAHQGWVTSLSVLTLDDGTVALVSVGEGEVRLWDLAKGVQLTSLASDVTPLSELVAFEGSDVLASVAKDGRAWIWDVRDAGVRQTVGVRLPRVTALCAVVLPRGRKGLALADDRSVRVWDLGSTRTALSWRTPKGPISAMSRLEFQGREALVAGAVDGSLGIWDTRRGIELVTVAAHAGEVREVGTLPFGDGELIVSVASGNDGIHVRDLELNAQPREVLAHGAVVACLALAHGPGRDSMVVFGDDYGRVQAWAPGNGIVAAVHLSGEAITVVCPVVLPGRVPGFAIGGASGSVWVWRPSDGTCLPIYRHDGRVRSLCEIGRTLASTGGDGVLRLYDIEGGHVTTLVVGPEPDGWIGYREGSTVSDGIAAWGSVVGLDQLLLVGERWRAADVRGSHPGLRTVRARGVRRASPAKP